MRITTDLFKSKIARRFCVLFFVCALIPSGVLFAISMQRVTAQMEEQSRQRIKQETKAYSISLYDRMLLVDNTLKSMRSLVAAGKPTYFDLKSILGNEPEYIFVSISAWQGDTMIRWVFGDPTSHEIASLQPDLPRSGKTRIVVLPGQDRVNRIFFIVPDLHGQLPGYLVGEIRAEYLWGVGSESLLPPKSEMAIYSEDGQQLVGTVHSPGPDLRHLARGNLGSDSRLFEYTADGRHFLASVWSLFVHSGFDNGSWTVVLSRARDSIYANALEFRKAFLLIVLLALFLTLFLSLTSIRRSLEPLSKLKQGTQLVAARDFTSRLDIRSGDEFEELGLSFNSMTVQLQKQFKALESIDSITRAILSSLDQGKVIDTSLQMMREFFQADVVVLVQLVNPEQGRMKVHVVEGGGSPQIEYGDIGPKARREIFTNQPYQILYSDVSGLHDMLRELVEEVPRQTLSLPLTMERQLQAALVLGYQRPCRHDEEELQQARQLADQLTIGLSNAKLVSDLENLLSGTIEALARTVDAKSRWTAGHSERVAVMAGRIGRRMGLTDQQVDMLNRGGLLHDIGKIGISMAILDKPGRLSEEEYDEIKSHPAIGQKILEPIAAYRSIIPMVAQHHERHDGSGYPFGLKGGEIDFYARILIVADVYDALVSSRPYRDGWVLEKAIAYISDGAGTLFDPEVVKVFVEVADRG